MSNDYPPPPPPPPGDDQGQGHPGQGWGSTPPPPPPPNYGYPPGYAQQPPKSSPMAITALVLGIVGLVCCGCGVVFSVAAVVFGILGKKEIAESNGTKTGAGMAQAGFILGIVGIVISVLYLLLVAAGTIDLNMYSDVS
jgi:hypothetical protein